MTLGMGPTGTGIGPRGGRRAGWGASAAFGPGQALTPRQAQHRIRALRVGIIRRANEILQAAAVPLHNRWKANIAARGWVGDMEFGDDESPWEGSNIPEVEIGGGGEYSTGRYYNSITTEVSNRMEVHVGSTIPRPSGRGLRVWSYPEALEFGTQKMPAMPTLRPALDSEGPAMERKSREVFNALAELYLMGGPNLRQP